MSGGETNGAARIEGAIRNATREGRPAVAPFLTAGFPRPSEFPRLLDSVAVHADLIELGVPFSDPMADGVTIQRSSRRALEQGVTLAGILEIVRDRSRDVPIVLMSYLNPLLAYGVDRLARDGAAAGVAGLIVPDLPLEESLPLREAFDRHGVALVQLATPVSSAERVTQLAHATRGFLYAVTMTGTTGGALDGDSQTAAYLRAARAASPVPVLAGFGIRSAEQLRAVAAHCDGAIVGSALIEILERGGDAAAFVRELRGVSGGGSST